VYQDFEIEARDPGHAHLGVVLYSIRRRGPSFDHLCTKFEADCSIRSKDIKGRGPEIRLRDLASGHAHLWVVLWSIRREAPSSMSVPNLKRIAPFVQKT